MKALELVFSRSARGSLVPLKTPCGRTALYWSLSWDMTPVTRNT